MLPQLFDWQFFVPTTFRVLLGGYLLLNGYRIFRDAKGEPSEEDRVAFRGLGVLIFVLGGVLFVGAWTQAAAAVTSVLGIVALYLKNRNSPRATQTRAFYLFATVMALSLIFLGPGAYAIDLPL